MTVHTTLYLVESRFYTRDTHSQPPSDDVLVNYHPLVTRLLVKQKIGKTCNAKIKCKGNGMGENNVRYF